MNNLIAVYSDNKEVPLAEFWQQPAPIPLPRKDEELNFLGRKIKWWRTSYPAFAGICLERLKSFQATTWIPIEWKFILVIGGGIMAIKEKNLKWALAAPTILVVSWIWNFLFNSIVKEYELQLEDEDRAKRIQNPQGWDQTKLNWTKSNEKFLKKLQDLMSSHQLISHHLPILENAQLRKIWDQDVFTYGFKRFFPQAYQLSNPIVVSVDGEQTPFLSLRIRPKQQGSVQVSPFFITFYPRFADEWWILTERNHKDAPDKVVVANDGTDDIFKLLEELVTDQHQEYELDLPAVIQKENV